MAPHKTHGRARSATESRPSSHVSGRELATHPMSQHVLLEPLDLERLTETVSRVNHRDLHPRKSQVCRAAESKLYLGVGKEGREMTEMT